MNKETSLKQVKCRRAEKGKCSRSEGSDSDRAMSDGWDVALEKEIINSFLEKVACDHNTE